jgi:outer membrane protein assembly factor BamD (BamD/ComL family)
METAGMKVVVLAGVLAASTVARVFACGPEFEEAPPTLDGYLECLPQKSLEQIFAETSVSGTSELNVDYLSRIKDISARAKNEPAGKLIGEVDELLKMMRASGGDHDGLALLHDLRDGLASAPAQCVEYLDWRMDHAAAMKPPESNPYEFPQKPPPVPPSSLTAEIEKHAADPKDPMRAHWLYLRGAISFNYNDKEEAQKWFDKVVQEYPDHPRAEMALFMSGRCLLSESRGGVNYGQPPQEISQREALAKQKQADAIARFRQYLQKYPNGRFVADAYGWLGALDGGVTSLDDYIREVETPGHPEVLESGIAMIQQRLGELVGDTTDEDAAVDLVAKHPRVAMGMLYVVVSASGDDSDEPSDSQPDQTLPESPTIRVKKWRDTILPKLAAAVAAQKGLYQPADVWEPRYLAILAHAASNAGAQEDALKLTEMDSKALEQNDDLLLVRAIALQRAGKAPEAIAAYQSLLAQFPTSPFAPDVRVRYGIALRDNHQSGLAVVEMQQFLTEEQQQEKWGAGSFYVPVDDVRQVIDALLNFAPVPELAAALDEKAIDPGYASALKAIIAGRALSQEDFATARKFMTPAEYGLGVANLEKLTDAANTTGNRAERAEIEAQLGDAWEALRGKLLYLKGLPADFGDQTELADVNRRINGKALGYENVESELDGRDELRHGSRWWLRAARLSPGTPLSATCRLKALEGLAKVARDSDYSFQRAIEENMAAASHEIYDKLQAESPHSVQAKEAAYLTFRRPQKDDVGSEDFWDGKFAFSDYETQMRRQSGYYWDDYGLVGESMTDADYNGDMDDSKGWDDIRARVLELRHANDSVAELAEEVKELRALVTAHFTSATQTGCLNFLDDLGLFLAEPVVTDDIAHRYVNLRLDVLHASSWYPAPVVPNLEQGADDQIRDRIAAAISDPKMKPVVDYLAFLDAAVVANTEINVPRQKHSGDKDDDDSYGSRDYPALEKMLRAFLEKYPHSHKREAARLLLARAVFRQSWPRIETIETDTGETSTYVEEVEPLSPKRVLAELDAYDREFPNGRYSPEIRDMRASVCWRSGDWKPALDLTLRQLDEQLPDLRRDAVLRLANIFAELENPEHRPALMAAIRKNPSALAWLKDYLAKAPNYRDHPLRFLSGYLEDQLGIQPAVAENQKAQ